MTFVIVYHDVICFVFGLHCICVTPTKDYKGETVKLLYLLLNNVHKILSSITLQKSFKARKAENTLRTSMRSHVCINLRQQYVQSLIDPLLQL